MSNRPKKYPRYYLVHLMPEYRGDSLDALAYAKRNNHHALDWNFQVTKDNIIVNTHWGKPLQHGFHDPLGRIHPNTNVWDMTWREVSRLRTRTGYRIHTARFMLKRAGEAGILVEFEAKGSPQFTGEQGVAIFERVKRMTERYHVKIVVKTLSTLPGAPERLTAAHTVGLTTLILPRGNRMLKRSKYWGVTDFHRGVVIWV